MLLMVFSQMPKSVDHNPAITNFDKDLAKRLDPKDIIYLIKIRGIQKFEKKKKNSIDVSFLVIKIKKMSNLCVKKMF